MINIKFRPLEYRDIAQMYQWLRTDFVSKWYEKEGLNFDEIEKKYIPYITGQKPIKAYIILINGIDIGYIQTYLIKDYPEYNQYVQADDFSAGVDLFIGHEEYIYKGYGKKIMKEFLQDSVFSNPTITQCIIGPEPKNKSAIRMYEKTGFQWYKTIQLPDEEEPEHLMKLSKADFMESNKL